MLTGVILTGDDKRHIEGKVKGLLPFEGGTLIYRQIKEISKLCDEIILVTNEPRSYLPEVNNAIRIITEFIPGKGSISGMHAAASLAKFNDLWVVGSNMPFISSEAALSMWKYKQNSQCEAVIPVLNEKSYPLHGLYDKKCTDKMNDMLKKGNGNVMDLLERVNTARVSDDFFAGMTTEFVLEINTNEDYHSVLRMEQKVNSVR